MAATGSDFAHARLIAQRVVSPSLRAAYPTWFKWHKTDVCRVASLRAGEASMGTDIRTGFVGLGSQGAPIARRMADGGFALTLWARRAETLAPFADGAIDFAASPADLGASCEHIGMCVVNDDDVRHVVLGQGLLDAMKPGALLAIHSTVLPETVSVLAQEAAARGVRFLDAPVSGGPKGAEAGTMTVMVGGDKAALEQARPVFATFATHIAHLGDVGAGQMMKLLNNNLCYANLAMGVHALELADRLGMDRHVVASLIRSSSGASAGFAILTDPVMLAKISGPTSNLEKDVGHLLDVTRNRDVTESGLLAVSQQAARLIGGHVRKFGID